MTRLWNPVLWTLPLLILTVLNGCATKTQEGAAKGAAIGAVAGAIIGHQSGERDEGALIGAIAGAAIGGVIGRRLDRQAAELERVAETRRTEHGLLVNLSSENVYFETNRANVNANSRTKLLEIGSIIRKYPEDVILIAGHTDNVGKNDYNLRLSELRAQAVGDILAEAGVPRASMSMRGYGETQPVASNQSAAGRAENRRVTLRITVDESKVPAQN